jgi:predicted N-acyltransferase
MIFGTPNMAANFDIQVANSVTEIGQEPWDRLVAGQPFASYGWCLFGEAVQADIKPVYIVLSSNSELVAGSIFWLTRQEPLSASRLTRTIVQSILQRWPLLVCRSPMVSHAGLFLPDSPIRDEALAAIARTAREIGHQHNASFVIFDYVDPGNNSWPWPPEFELFTIANPSTALEIAWPDFESYLDQLPKSVRKDYRRHHNRANDLGIRVTTHDRITHITEALPLIRSVEQKHGSAPNTYVRAILEKANMVSATWLTAEMEGHLVGCGLLLGDGCAQVLSLLGLDYNARYAYFQLMYAAIQAAIDAQTRILHGGSGVYELKERLGFKLQHSNHIALAADRWVFRQLARAMS